MKMMMTAMIILMIQVLKMQMKIIVLKMIRIKRKEDPLRIMRE